MQAAPSETAGGSSPQQVRQIFQAAIRYSQCSSRPVLAIAPEARGGIIIQKAHYADFIGPGAALVNSFDLRGNKVIPVGTIRFCPLRNAEDRQRALGKRVEYLRTLEEIARSPVPLRRSCQIVERLCEWLPESEAAAISHELVGNLVGVMPLAVQMAWRSYRSRLNDDTMSAAEEEAGSAEEIGSDLLESVAQVNTRSLLQSRLPSLRSS